jgi:hypothetical protein
VGNLRRLRLELLEDRLAPATLTVNSTADTASPTDPYLSLREAVAIVNSPSLPSGLSNQILGQISGTLHQGGSDTVVFDPAVVTSPITLGGTQLRLSLPGSTAVVTIDGGSGVTLDGNNATRVLEVAGGVEATLRHLTIAHGHIFANGSGILNNGSLTISNCTLSSNTAAPFPGRAPSGGGIFSTSMLTVTDSTISNNLSGNGGGISTDNHSTLTVSNCNLTGNTAISSTGSGGSAGGIDAFGSSVTVTNSTLTSNSAGVGGGIATDRSTLTVSDCTLAGNRAAADGGGIYNFPGGSALTVSNSTLTGPGRWAVRSTRYWGRWATTAGRLRPFRCWPAARP